MHNKVITYFLIFIFSWSTIHAHERAPKVENIEVEYTHDNPWLFRALKFILRFIGTSYASYKLTPAFSAIEEKLSPKSQDHISTVWNAYENYPEKELYTEHLHSCPLCSEVGSFLRESIRLNKQELDSKINAINQRITRENGIIEEKLNDFSSRLLSLEVEVEKIKQQLNKKAYLITVTKKNTPIQKPESRSIDIVLSDFRVVKKTTESPLRLGIYFKPEVNPETLKELSDFFNLKLIPYGRSGLMIGGNYDIIIVRQNYEN